MKLTSLLPFVLLFVGLPDFLDAQSRSDQRAMEVKVDGKPVQGILSPNEDQIVWSDWVNRGKQILVADLEGKEWKAITDDNFCNQQPTWAPDGKKIIFTSNRSGKQQIYSISLDGTDLEPLTDEPHGARNPLYSSQGHFAWKVMHPRSGKIYPSDVMVRLAESGTEKQLTTSTFNRCMAWSPNGETLVVATPASIQFFDVESDETKSVPYTDVHEGLRAHCVTDLQWSPDGDRIACRIPFFGGRMEGTKSFGDDEMFVVAMDGSAESFETREQAIKAYEWISIK